MIIYIISYKLNFLFFLQENDSFSHSNRDHAISSYRRHCTWSALFGNLQSFSERRSIERRSECVLIVSERERKLALIIALKMEPYSPFSDRCQESIK